MKWLAVALGVLFVGLWLWIDRSPVAPVEPGAPARAETHESRAASPDGSKQRRASLSGDEEPDEALEFGAIRAAEVDRSKALVGSVLDPSGQPVSGALVLVGLEEVGGTRAHPGRVFSDKGGRFVFPLSEDFEAPLIVMARSAEFAPGQARTSGRQVEVVLSPGAVVRGRVVDSQGSPLPGAEVVARPWRLVDWFEVDSIDERRVVVGEDGSFELAGVAGATLVTTATLAGYADVREVRSDPAEIARPWTLEMLPGTALAGTFWTPERDPVAGLGVKLATEVQSQHAKTGADGTFRFDRVPVGSATLAWETEEGGPELRRWASEARALELPTEGPIDVVLTPAAVIRGRVLTASGERYAVHLQGGDVDWSERFGESVFSIGGLPSGSYEVSIEPEGAPARAAGIVQVAAGGTADIGTVSLGRGTAVFGRAEFLSGEPVGGDCELARFTAERITWKPVASTSIAPSGYFEFTGLEAGRYQVTVTPDEGLLTTGEPRFVAAGAEVDLGLVLCSRAQSLTVEVIGADGRALPGETVQLSSQRTLYSSQTDPAGLVRFDSVAPGEARVLLALEDGYRSVPIVVPEGEEARVKVDLRSFGVGTPWAGRLRDSTGPLNASLSLSALDGSWSTRDSATESDGRFVLRGDQGGPALLRVYLRSRKASLRLRMPSAPRPTDVLVQVGSLEGVVRGTAGVTLPVEIERLEWSRSGVAELVRLGQVYAQSATDSEGSFEFLALPVGPYRLRVLTPDGRVIEQGVEVQAGMQRLEVDLE